MDKVIGYKLSEQELLEIRAKMPMNMEQHNSFHMAGEVLELRKSHSKNPSQLESEQKLIDLMYEIAMKAYEWHAHNDDVTMPDIAQWVTNALRSCGYETMPCGSAWGVLIK
jgi:hypothetical protein